MSLAEVVGLVIVVALNVYALTGGADFGGGVWDLLARGPRAARQRDAIEHAIAPIWEANHVWLILVIVLLFSAFPPAFAVITTALHVPLAAMLVGIVLRGSAFVFRSYGIQGETAAWRWGRVFAIASVVTPVMLGVSLAATIAGRIRIDPATGVPTTGFFAPWLGAFPFLTGLFTLALFAYLAAVYLTVEVADEPALADDFRRHALAAAVAVGVLAWATLAAAREGAPLLYARLLASSWALPFQLVTGALAIAALAALWRRRWRLARALAIAQVTCIVWGWAWAQRPHLVVPDVTFAASAAEDAVLRPILIALAAGSLLLLPAFGYLYAVFKGRRGGSMTPAG